MMVAEAKPVVAVVIQNLLQKYEPCRPLLLPN